MTSPISGFPEKPLSEADIQAVDQHPAIEFCHPVYTRADEPDAIVVIALAKGQRAYFFYFDPEAQQWDQLVATEMPTAVTDEIPFDEQDIDEKLAQHYDPYDLEPAGYPNDPVEAAVNNFPSEPLTDQQLRDMQTQHPMIGAVMPLVNSTGSKAAIALIFFFDDLINEERITVATGYNPEIGDWQVIATAESADPELDQSLEQLETAYATWVDAHYTIDEIAPIEDPEAALIA